MTKKECVADPGFKPWWSAVAAGAPLSRQCKAVFSQSASPGTTGAALLGNLLEMQIL